MIVRWLRSLIARGSSAAKSPGQLGEDLAAKWLRQNGYRILHRNFPVGDDEADLIALDPDGCTIVIIEVKTRSQDDPTAPEAAITQTKQYRQSRLAARLMKMREFAGRPIRFDAVAVIAPESPEPIIRHHPGAFEAPW